MDNSLFSEEMLNATIADNAIENKGPVKVLGMEFANDDERRAYFREELRKKLPELKQIEGFPIGEEYSFIGAISELLSKSRDFTNLHRTNTIGSSLSAKVTCSSGAPGIFNINL